MEKNIYSRAKVSVRALDAVIFVGLAAILLVTVYLSATGGFDITFDTDGGSAIAPQRLRYGESIVEPEAPIKEGHVFLGWFSDKELTQRMDFSTAIATQTATVYAAWKSEE